MMKKKTTMNTDKKHKCNEKIDFVKVSKVENPDDLSEDMFEMLAAAGMDFNTFLDMVRHKKNVSVKIKENTAKWKQLEIRNWLKNRKLEKYVDFSDDYRDGIKKYFNSMDTEGQGQICLDKLEDPLITLGITNDFDEVEQIQKTIDSNGNGFIEFEEFLGILNEKSTMKQSFSGGGNTAILDFFKNMIDGKLSIGGNSKTMPFNLVISTLRRKKIMSILESKNVNKEEVNKTMAAYSKLQNRQRNQTHKNSALGKKKGSKNRDDDIGIEIVEIDKFGVESQSLTDENSEDI